MAKMMMGQIEHARSRVREIKCGLTGEAPEPVKEYDDRDLAEAIADGSQKFSGPQMAKFFQEWAKTYLKEGSYSYNRTSLQGTALAYAFEKERAADKKRFAAENAVYQDRVKRVNAEATKVEDAIVLGDQHAALIALQEFATFKP